MLMSGASEAVTSILDAEVVTFVIDGVKQVIAILTTPPLGVFLTIGLLGAVVSIVGTIVSLVRRS